MEIGIESINKGHSHSWVRISHGWTKLVTDLSNNKEHDDNEQETSEMQFDNFALTSNVLALVSRSKAKAKPQRRIFASSSTKIVPVGGRTWTDIETQDYSSVNYSVSMHLISRLRHGHLPREDDGVIDPAAAALMCASVAPLSNAHHWSERRVWIENCSSGVLTSCFFYC